MVLGEDLDAEIKRQEEMIVERSEYIAERENMKKEIELELPRERILHKQEKDTLKKLKKTKVNLSIFDRRFLQQH